MNGDRANFLTVSDLATLLNCKESYIYQKVHRKQIPYIKLGYRKLRFNHSDINKWLEQLSVKEID